MKPTYLVLALAIAASVSSASAQWRTETYSLRGGWNSVYLHGDASHATPAQHFAAGDGLNVTEIWRWNPNPSQVGFTSSPLIPAPGTPEWSVWVRDQPGASTLSQLEGGNAYLIKCVGDASDNYSVSLIQKPLVPSATWVRSGANFLGFPAKTGSPVPNFNQYFATFPAATAASSKIFKYVGGEFGPGNPLQVFSPGQESLDRHQAYWFESAVVGNFYAPLEIEVQNDEGLNFGRSGSVATVNVTNRTQATVTVTLAPGSSENAPVGQPAVSGDVPLTLRRYDSSTATFSEVAVTGPIDQAVAPGATFEFTFSVNRAAMPGVSGVQFASLLTFTDSSNLVEIDLPVSATVSSLAGLWVGEALVDGVDSNVAASPGDSVRRPFPLRYIMHLDDAGTASILSQVFIGSLAGGSPGVLGLATEEALLQQDAKAEAARLVATHMPLDRVLSTGSGSFALNDTLVRTIETPYTDGVNPFSHQYHPDHDNKDARFAELSAAKAEAPSLSRTVSFTFSPTALSPLDATGWGNSVIGGAYSESVSGLHKKNLTVSGTFTLRRMNEIGTLVTAAP